MFIEQKHVKVANLTLDPENPRLPSYLSRTPDEILKFLAISSSIDELMSAIGSNGFFQSEPLIAVKNGQSTIIVVEGNRRLTALKILSGEEFDGMPHRLKSIVVNSEHKPDEVPVSIYSDRSDILNYLGNKHIAGVKPWGALAKARYAKQLFETTDANHDYTTRIRTVAKTIGSRSDFISRAIKALEAYETAENHEFFGLDGVDEETVKFSLLSTALDYEGIQRFVYENPEDDVDNREIVEENLKNLFSWMFQKTDEGKSKLGESRNLMQLSKVVMNEEGLRRFKLGMSLDQAFKLTDGIDEEFDTIVTRVQSGLREANSIAADVSDSEERESTVKSIVRQARQLKNAFDHDDD